MYNLLVSHTGEVIKSMQTGKWLLVYYLKYYYTITTLKTPNKPNKKYKAMHMNLSNDSSFLLDWFYSGRFGNIISPDSIINNVTTISPVQLPHTHP